jgi:uncharacterized membrane protein YGL010W
MRTADDWFAHYATSHQHPTNKRIHAVCIPVIALSTLGLLQAAPHPFGDGGLHWGAIAGALSLVFYFRLSLRLGLAMAVGVAAALAVNAAIVASGLSLLAVSAGLFVAAWIAQFVGHRIEGKKPSFFDDLQFLLVGPAWLVDGWLRRA